MLHMLVLPATSFAMIFAAMCGAGLPIGVLQALHVHTTVVYVVFAFAGGFAGIAGAYMIGDRLNDRIRRLRAPIGSAAIGTDGIRWRHFGKTDFIAWSSVREIAQNGQEVVIRCEGRDATLVIQQAELFADAARRALRAYRDGEPAEDIAALEFAGDGVSDWLARARRLLEGGSYREAGVGEEQCVRVAIDPRAPIAQRIGSAAALSKASDDARNRVRVAIEDTADPVLANALEDALESRGVRAITGVLTTRK